MEGEWFVGVSCVADALGCKRSDIYDLVTRGFLDFIRMPDGQIKISTESLTTFAGVPSIDSDESFPGSFVEWKRLFRGRFYIFTRER